MNIDTGSVQALVPWLDSHVLSQALAFVQVVFIDIVMAGDNAVAIGIAAAGLPADKRKQAIFYGLIGAVVIRIGFVLVTVELLKIVGLLLAGGLLLLWVTWKMYREMRDHHENEAREAAEKKAAEEAALRGEVAQAPLPPKATKHKTLASAVLQILAADVSMSLDNVLAVAGAAQQHVWVLAFGLIFAFVAMGVAANYIAKLLHRYAWIGYVGVLVVFVIAMRMIYEGSVELWTHEKCDLTFSCLSRIGADMGSQLRGPVPGK